MDTFYHGTDKFFTKFSLDFVGKGAGRFRFGYGISTSDLYTTAVHYAGVSGKQHDVDTYYVYTLEIPEVTESNHLFSDKPVNEVVVDRIEKALGVKIPDEAKVEGKYFRKYVANLLTKKKGTVKQMIGAASADAERKVSKFMKDNGILYYVAKHGKNTTKRIIVNPDIIKIVKIEQVQVDGENKFIEGSNTEVKIPD